VYADVEPGAPVALVGSNGLLEIAVRDGSAAARLGARRGARVVLRAGPGPTA
jgi:S-adenosylmethionine hydrolase